MSMRRSQRVPVPDDGEWFRSVLQQAIELPKSGSFADLIEALDATEPAKPDDTFLSSGVEVANSP
jgi:hypothetical protein